MENLKGVTSKGTEYELSATGHWEGRYGVTFPKFGVRDASAVEKNLQGIDCLQVLDVFNIPALGGQARPAVPITPEIRAWIDGVKAEREAERAEKAAAQEAAIEIGYFAGPMSDLPTLIEVDSRLTDEDILAGLGEKILKWNSREDLLQRIASARAKRAAKERAQAKAEAHRAKVFARARETGEPQELARRSEPCEEPDCSLDLVTVWALPNGQTRTDRVHTH